MCKCNPNIRIPFCGKLGCEWPKQINTFELGKSRIYVLTKQVAGGELELISYTDDDAVLDKWKELSTPAIVRSYFSLKKAKISIDFGDEE